MLDPLKAKNLHSGKTLIIAQADPSLKTVLHATRLFPTVAVSGNMVVWNTWRGQTGNLTSSISLFNLRSHYRQLRVQTHMPDSFADVALSGHWAVWAKIHTEPGVNGLPCVSSTLWLDDLARGACSRSRRSMV